MSCPQCGAEVPADDAFCGKCGYAMRDEAPGRVDQSRIRVHEEPEPAPVPTPAGEHTASRSTSQPRIRKHTVMGMPSAGVPREAPAAPPRPEPPPPTEIGVAREQTRRRAPQKTMLGIPRPELPERPEASEAAPGEVGDESIPTERFAPPTESQTPSHRARARVRYDSANESYPKVERRKKALRALAVLVVLAGAWLAFRYLSLNG